MVKQGTLLVVDDNKNILTSLQYLLSGFFTRVITSSTPVTIPTLLQQEKPEVVLLDMNFSAGLNTGNEGIFWLREIKRIRPQTQVVLFTAYADINLAVTGLKEGAVDFVVKPWDNSNLVSVLKSAYEKTQPTGKRTVKAKAETNEENEMYWGTATAVLSLKKIVEKVSMTDANILITGENGTGKDMLAHEIHRRSGRHDGPFVSVDMGAITETLFESELFGHVKGSFTDAHSDRIGRFEAANGGTLFLDEIANLPLHMQPKLLTAIQKRSFVKVGSNVPQPTNIRLICATNCNLEEMVQEGTFREDLLYRINTIYLHIPSLRERKEDILPLAKRFMQVYATQYGRQVNELSDDAIQRLLNHPWYGNIRELQHTIEKAVILSEGQILKADNLTLSAAKKPHALADVPDVDVRVQRLDEVECAAIRKAIEQSHGNLSLAASGLGITRQTLYNKMKKYGI